jgi:hypothetical protein
VYPTWLKQFQDVGTIVAAMETITQQMLQKTWKKIECRLDILRAMKGAHVEIAWHSTSNETFLVVFHIL